MPVGDLGERLPFAEIADPQGDDKDDHHGADEGGEVAVDAVQSDLGEDGGQRGEKGGEQRVKEPGHIGLRFCVFCRCGSFPCQNTVLLWQPCLAVLNALSAAPPPCRLAKLSCPGKLETRIQ